MVLAGSSPIGVTSTTWPPSRAASSAARAAPPGRRISVRSSSTGAGASGQTRLAVPFMSRSSSASPITTSGPAGVMAGSPPRRARRTWRGWPPGELPGPWRCPARRRRSRRPPRVASGFGGRAGHGPDPDAERPGPVRGGQHVLAAAAGRQQQQRVAGPAVRRHLPGERLGRAEVVADRGQAGCFGVQRDCRQRGPVGHIPADQLGGQVLGLGGTAPVPGHEQPVPGGERRGEQPPPAPRGPQPGLAGCAARRSAGPGAR